MNLVVRRLIPALYGVAVLIGFLINTTTGIVVTIVGGVLSAVAWPILARTNPVPEGLGRQRNRKRYRLSQRRNGNQPTSSAALIASARLRAFSLVTMVVG
jgi:hypothetical protein